MIKVYSHPRSGTNWLLALLNLSRFGAVRYRTAVTGHWSRRYTVQAPGGGMFGGHGFYNGDRLPDKAIYIYRDGRDVVRSLWQTKGFQPKLVRCYSLAEFLEWPLDWLGTPGTKALTRPFRIASHWKAHLNSWKDSGAYLVRYEDLLTEPIETYRKLARYCGLLDWSYPGEGLKGVGPNPSGSFKPKKWLRVFTPRDLEIFYRGAPAGFWGLWEGG